MADKHVTTTSLASYLGSGDTFSVNDVAAADRLILWSSEKISSDYSPLSGGTFTGLINFSGTDHAGLQVISLTTVQRDALSATAGMVIYNSTDSELQGYDGTNWLNLGAGAGGGETNTASNVGTGGVGVFKQKTAVDLEFKKINAGSAKITITDDTGNDEIDIDLGTVAVADLSDGGALAVLNTVATAQIDNTAVTFAKIQDISTSRLLGRTTAGSGSVEELTAAQVRTLLNVEDGATADMSDAEIKTAYENNADTNAFTDAEQSKLSGIEASADVTDETNVTAAFPISDATALVKDPIDGTKLMRIDVGAVSTATTRILTMPDSDVDLGSDFAAASHTHTLTDITDSGALAALATVGTTEIDNNAVTFDKLEDVAQDRLLGRVSVGTGNAEELTAAQVRTLINVEDGADVTDATNVAAAGAVMDGDFSANGMMQRTGAGTYTTIKINLSATTAPAATDDSSAGYAVGSQWVDTTNDKAYICLDSTATSAVWTEITQAGGGAGGDLWSDVVDADIIPDADGTRDLGNTTTRFAETYTDALDVTNDIVVGGTVDGRDLATDGTKLDGIEASADVTDEANVTAALPVSDATTLVKDPVDGTKAMRIDVGAVSTATTRVLTMPDNDVNLGSDFAAASHTHTLADITDSGALAALDTVATAQIDNNAVTFAKLEDVAQDRILGRVTAGTGDTEELTAAQVRTLINVEDGATADQTGAEIKTAYEAEADTNAFTDAEKTKLAGIETAADVTDETNVTAALPVSDATTLVKDPVDGTKRMRIDVGAVSTATTRVLTMPDSDVNLGSDFATASHTHTLTDVTDSGALAALNTVATAQIDNNAVTFAKLEDVAQDRIVGRVTAGTGDAEELTAAQVRTLINVEDGADVTDATNVAAAGAIMDSDISAGEGFLRKTGAGAYEAIKTNIGATVAPTANEDSGDGYAVGSRWLDTTNDKEYVCLDATVGAAVWTETTAAAGAGAVEDSDFTANGIMERTGSGTYTTIKINKAATTAPAAGDDTLDGYSIGSQWIDTTNDKAYICLDATTATAVWTEITGGGGGFSPLTTNNDLYYYSSGDARLPGPLLTSDLLGTDTSGALAWKRRTDEASYFSHFSSLWISGSQTGTGAQAAVVGECMATGTSSSGIAVRYLSTVSSTYHRKFWGWGPVAFEQSVAFSQLSSASDEYEYECGILTALRNTSSTTRKDGIMFRYDRATDGATWRCVTRNGGTETNTDSGVTVTAATQHLRWEVNSAMSSVTFYINGASVATNTTNIVTAGAAACPHHFIEKSAGTTDVIVSLGSNDGVRFRR